ASAVLARARAPARTTWAAGTRARPRAVRSGLRPLPRRAPVVCRALVLVPAVRAPVSVVVARCWPVASVQVQVLVPVAGPVSVVEPARAAEPARAVASGPAGGPASVLVLVPVVQLVLPA